MTGDDALVQPDAVEPFLTRFFSIIAGTDYVLELRALARGRAELRPKVAFFGPRGLQRACAFSVSCAKAGYDVYLAPNPRLCMSGVGNALASLRWLFFDIDVGEVGHATAGRYEELNEALEAIRNVAELYDVNPAITTITGGGVHVFYALRESTNPVAWRWATERLVHALGADPNAVQAQGVLRVAGTLNRKRSPARPVRLHHLSDETVAIDAILAMPGGPDPIESHAHTARTSPSAIRRPARQLSLLDRPFDRANDVPVADVLIMLGCELQREGGRVYCVCPVCGGTNHRKMAVGGRSNVATCFGDCGVRTFTAVDLVIAASGCTPREAVNRLAAAFGFEGFEPRSP